MSALPPFQPYNGKESYVFVSYAHQDREKVFPIIDHLDKRGLRLWYDEGVDPGTEWPEEIAVRLMGCTVFLLFTTPYAMDSHNVRREINMAIKHKKKLLNIQLTPTELSVGMDMQLSLIQYLTYTDDTREDFLDRLQQALEKLLGASQAIRESSETDGSGQESGKRKRIRKITEKGKLALPMKKWLAVILSLLLTAVLSFVIMPRLWRPVPTMSQDTIATGAPDAATEQPMKTEPAPEETEQPQKTNTPKPEETAQPSIIYDHDKFVIDGDELISYLGSDEEVIVPKGVSIIREGAFYYKNARRIKLPATVTDIETNAFLHCDNLKELLIPEGLLTLYEGAITDCASLAIFSLPSTVLYLQKAFIGLTGLQQIISRGNPSYIDVDGVLFSRDMEQLILYPAGKSATHYSIPEGVKEICDNAFENAKRLDSISLPDSIREIDSYAFAGCDTLDGITLPEGLLVIGESAFSGCSQITEIRIPRLVISIGRTPFDGCDSLTAIQVATDNGIYASTDGVLMSRDGKHLYAYPCGHPQTVYTVPAEVLGIEASAFHDCKNLKEIVIPGNTIYIGERAFEGCRNLMNIALPQGLLSIGDYAFDSCDKLLEIQLPAYLLDMDFSAFPRNLVEIKVDGTNAQFASVGGVLYTKDKKVLLYYPRGKQDEVFTVPEETTIISQFAISGIPSLKSVLMGDQVRRIENYAFNSCINLTNITFSKNLKSIGACAFSNCDIQKLVIPDGVEIIGYAAFARCQNLTEVRLPSTLKSIADRLFVECFSLESVDIPDGVERIGNASFLGCNIQHELIIPDSVGGIGDEAFHQALKNSRIVLPESIEYIGEDAFKQYKSNSEYTIVCVPDSYAEKYAKEQGFASEQLK